MHGSPTLYSAMPVSLCQSKKMTELEEKMLFEKYALKSFKNYEDFSKNFQITIPENYNFAFDCIDVLARQTPDKKALFWCNENGDERQYSFSELSRLSNAAARFFLTCGIKKGDKVMLILKRRAQYWYAVLGLMKIGAISIPATHLLTQKDISYRNKLASISSIISIEEGSILKSIEDSRLDSPSLKNLFKLGEKREGWISFDDGITENMDGDEIPRNTQNNDLMMLYFTSGTTGMPKMVAHNYTYPLGHIATARFWHNLDENSLHLSISDTGWAKASWGKMFGQWLCESTVFVYDHERFHAKDMLKIISKYKITSFCAPPTVFRFLVREDISAYDLHALKSVTTAGESLNPEVFHQFQNMTGLIIREAYGQTETTPLIMTSIYSQSHPGALGKPNPLYDVLLLDENCDPVPIGEEGEICLKLEPGQTPGVFTGYYRDKELTKNTWYNGIYHTGDRASLDEEGYLWFIGRADDMIKSSGYRIGPFEVESTLMEHPAVLECAVTGEPDSLRGQIVKATIVLAKNYLPTEDLKKKLQEYVKNATAAYKYPRLIDFVPELPKTISGKIRRVALREKPNQSFI